MYIHNHPIRIEPSSNQNQTSTENLQLLQRIERNLSAERFEAYENVKSVNRFEPFCLDHNHSHFSKNIFPDCQECKDSLKDCDRRVNNPIGMPNQNGNQKNKINMPLCLTMENFKCLGSDSNMSLDEVFNMRASLKSLNKKDNNATPQLIGKPRMISLDNSSSLS